MVDVSVEIPESVEIGEEFDLTVAVTAVTNFDAGQFDVVYDHSLVQLVSVSDGDIGGVAIPFAIYNEKFTPDSMRVVVNVPGIPGVTGEGSLAVIRFKAVKGGSATFGLENVFINDNKAVEIESQSVGAETEFFRLGDADYDGVVTVSDIGHIANIICGLETATIAADALADGMMNTADLTKAEMILAETALVTVNAPGSVAAGDDFTVPVQIANVSGCSGAQFTVNFDPDILRLDSIDDGTLDRWPRWSRRACAHCRYE